MASGSPNPPAYSAKIKNFNGGYFIRNKLYSMALIIILCSVFYFIGVWVHSSTSDITTNWTSTIADNPINCSSSRTKTITIHVSESPNLDFTSHHTAEDTIPMSTTVSVAVSTAKYYPPCDVKYSEYTPCEDTDRSLKFDRERSIYRERHCPEKGELLKCRIPAPFGYRIPFRWPKSRDFAWYANVPHKHLTMAKARQNWVRSEGDRFGFPGGGTTFPKGAGAYIDDIGKLINLRDGSIRTAIDTGCGVASWGAYLLSRNILTMSFAPKDSHEAQVQFAIERGVPALLGILASIRLPYPSRAFDMAHCSRCLIPWAQNDGQYLIEVDRVLRPGGYWVLSGPPINFKKHRKGWKRTREDLSSEQLELEAVAKSLCWRKLVEKADIAIWQKPINHIQCKTNGEIIQKPPICQANDPDKAWYTKMATCLTPLPNVSDANDFAGGKLTKWPERLTAIPPRISSGSIEGYTEKTFKEDTHLWEKRVGYYKNVNNELRDKGRYRNLLDMNAHLGGFAAALVDYPLWVMNVVPTESKINTLGVIYERGLIGTYQNWCEAMSTYPRSYDLLHADSVFSLYKDRCEMEDILLEMDRILRPEGTAIIRDDIDILLKIKSITDGLQWNSRIVDHEDSPHNREKLLFVTKMYWTAPDRREANPAS